jgi:hypothetical protein
MEWPELPTTLYHYTDVRGLFGIIQEQAIWASNIQYLNDSQEYDYAVTLAKEVLLERAQATADQKEKELLTALGTRLSTGAMINVFVASFSEEGDLLSQWRGYCPNGAGYNIGFAASDLYNEALLQYFSLAPCLYEYEAQHELIGHVLSEVMSLDLWTAGLQELEADDLFRRAVELWQERFVPLASRIKHWGFREEREWRLISRPITISYTDRRWTVRPGRSMLIPYIPIKLAMIGPHIPTNEIIVGPTPHMDLAIRSVADWLGSKDISRPQPHNIPHRNPILS